MSADKTHSKKLFGFSTLKIKQSVALRVSENDQQPPSRKEERPLREERSNREEKPIRDKRLLIEKNYNMVGTTSSLHKKSIDDSILNKLKKTGLLSNNGSRQSSPRQSFSIEQARHSRKKSQSKVGLNENTSVMSTIDPSSTQSKNHYNYRHAIGRGGFGKVWKVEQKKTKKLFAMKEMSKALIITKKSVPSVMNEKRLLSQLKHPFLVNMTASFQDRETLFLVMDLMPGGDLRYHIGRKRRFSEDQTKFFVACIFLGLEYLHNNNIIHRDIKPENLVLDDKGYVRITDLGIARYWKENNACDTSGTPGYMSPEVICRQNHSFSADYFAMGVIAYEFMLGRRPYYGRNRNEIREEILAKQIQVKKTEIPDNWSLESADFVNRLLQRKPGSRLGHQSSEQIRKHPWLRSFPWQKLYNKEIPAPFRPDVTADNFDQDQMSSQNQENEQLLQNTMLLRNSEVQGLFEGYESNNQIL